MKKPPPPCPADCTVAYIRNPRFDNTPPVRLVILSEAAGLRDGEERYWVPVKRKPPVFHAVKGKNLNWTIAEGFKIARVQAVSLCGVQPDPGDPVFAHNGWEPKHWRHAEKGTVVSCDKCLARMRAALRPKFKYRPHGKHERRTRPFREHVFAGQSFKDGVVTEKKNSRHARDGWYEAIDCNDCEP